MSNNVRVRFAPSPTGGLHLGGVRTVLFNYLFAKSHGGSFILRIEDTDRTRFVEGAEEYIYDCLEWCGIIPDESTKNGGDFGPYRQSERKAMYRKYADKLIADGHAYYAFDTPEELEKMRNDLKTKERPNPQYDYTTRMSMRNSLSLSKDEVVKLIASGTPYVIRIHVKEGETVHFSDMIRGDISHSTSTLDDKVLLKADGMPTYHLAVVVDDYLMRISHAFRGEEWLPSAPIHVLLWKYLGWEKKMPLWAHLPLILKPDGNGKLSKRDGDRLGFPVFAMNWTDPKSGDLAIGFKEQGFLPDAFVNILAMLGWNDGTEQEVFSMEELIKKFNIDRVHKGGAKFDFEKAKWYNHQYIMAKSNEELALLTKPFMEQHFVIHDDALLIKVISLVKERCHLLTDFWQQSHFFFEAPQNIDLDSIKGKWDENVKKFFESWTSSLDTITEWSTNNIEDHFTSLANDLSIKKGALMLPLRIMLVGGKYGPSVFDIAALIGKDNTQNRIKHVLSQL